MINLEHVIKPFTKTTALQLSILSFPALQGKSSAILWYIPPLTTNVLEHCLKSFTNDKSMIEYIEYYSQYAHIISYEQMNYKIDQIFFDGQGPISTIQRIIFNIENIGAIPQAINNLVSAIMEPENQDFGEALASNIFKIQKSSVKYIARDLVIMPILKLYKASDEIMFIIGNGIPGALSNIYGKLYNPLKINPLKQEDLPLYITEGVIGAIKAMGYSANFHFFKNNVQYIAYVFCLNGMEMVARDIINRIYETQPELDSQDIDIDETCNIGEVVMCTIEELNLYNFDIFSNNTIFDLEYL